ncbi:MAG: type II secretion system F family protein [Candidatus Kaiserbacteria bacterium]|nr:type II secretion system F family protein [Candidatus Kaiserbacteria bacterium]MCB9816829.1 type II secretion system F family protein [Candidatus Nomurabacteria bacterium]
MLFNYKAIDSSNIQREGTVEAPTVDAAISAVQKRGYTLVSIDETNKSEGLAGLMNIEFSFFQSVSNKEIVILSRQISTLFQAQVSPLRIFRLLSAEVENPQLQQIMNQIVEDLQAGSSISRALSSHPEVFSSFYVNLVRSGEESGSLEKAFDYLADYLDRQYEVISKARNALIYPAFVVGIFILVMGLMLTLVIPNIAKILTDSGQELPIYTKIVIGISDFMVNYIGFILIAIAGIGVGIWKFRQTDVGKRTFDEFFISVPYLGDLQRKLLLTRICDNMATMLGSGISIVQALEVTADVVDNMVYKEIIQSALVEVKGGRSFADSIAEYPEIPGVLAQMAKVGEETGSLGTILTTLSNFYRREVNNAVDTLIGLIEPAMIVMLGIGVGVLLASVLMPIYNLTSAF